MNDHVVYKFGGDKTALDRTLAGIRGSVASTGENVKGQIKGLQKSFELFSRFNFLLNITSQLEGWMSKARELGQWWGAFSAGGVKAVQQMQRAAGEANRIYELGQQLQAQREAYEKSIEKTKQMEFERLDLVQQAVALERELTELNKQAAEAQDKSWQKLELQQKARQKYLEHESKIKEVAEQRAKIQKEGDEAREKMNKAIAEAQERQNKASKEAIDALRSLSNLQRDLKLTKEDRSKFTLQELASLNARSVGGNLRNEVYTAREIQSLESNAIRLRDRGYFDQSQSAFNRADELRKGMRNLVESERNPFAAQEEAIKNSENHLRELVTKANSGGIPVAPANGP